ncbi:MAG: TIR domain-containing protein [Myxococcales bacterium]|nr:TIR domain-containing protein [Myxococcales bacterium]
MATGPIARGKRDVFLAYARNNATLAKAVDRFLRSAGLSVWFDQRDVPAGTLWLAAAARGVAQAGRLVILLTETTPRAWLRAEFDFAARTVARHPEVEVVPVIREGFDAGDFAVDLERLDPVMLPRDKALLEDHLKLLVARLSVPQGMPSMPPPPQGNPYPGLRPYGLADGRGFFGRERETVEATARLGTQAGGDFVRWLRVEGPAGVGKASFARAGLAPAIVRGAIAGGRGDWRVIAMRPSEDPFEAFAGAAVTTFNDLRPEAVRTLLAQPAGLADLIREGLAPDEGVLVVLDHLEDVLSAADTESLDAFDGLLADALDDFDQRLLLVTTNRSDLVDATLAALPRCADVARRHAAVLALGGLSRSGLRDVIEGPTRMVGKPLPADLAQRIRRDAERFVSAPARLSWMLQALCRGPRPTVGRYEALGGLGGGVARALDQGFAQLGDDDRQRTRDLLTALVASGRGRSDLPVAITWDEALVAAGEGPRAQALIQRLASPEAADGEPLPPALVQLTRDGQVDHVRLGHSALLSHWPTLSAWITADRAILERRADVEQAARGWLRAGADPAALPQGPLLALQAGDDLPEDQRRRLRASLRTRTRHYVEQAEAAQRQREADAKAAERAARDRAEKARDAEQRASRAHVRRLRLFVALGFIGAGAAAWYGLDATRREAEMRERVEWASQQRAQAVEALRDAEAKHLAAEQQRKAAERERRLTEHERRAADRQGAKAEQSADVVLMFAVEAAVEADEYFSRIPGNDGRYARRMYAEAVRARLESRLAEDPDNRRLRYLLARQHGLIGDLAADEGKHRASAPSYEAATEVIDALVALEPDERYVRAQAEAHTRLGRLLSNTRKGPDDPQAAVDHHRKAVEIWTTLAEASPDDRALQAQLADTRADLGLALMQVEGQGEAATAALAQSVTETRALVRANPSDIELIHALARRIGRLGEAEAAQGDFAGAVARYDEALRLLDPFTNMAEHRSLIRTRASVKRLRHFAKAQIK